MNGEPHDELLKSLGVDMTLHRDLVRHNRDLHLQTVVSASNRPRAMKWFDKAIEDSHGERVAEIAGYRANGGKSIGTFCIYVPDELALAADVLPIALCGGTNWSVDYADRMFPRDICPLIRSTFGMAFSNTCPYKKLQDSTVGETTCDAKKKAWDLLGFQVLEVPQKKEALDRKLWHAEVRRFREFVEQISGVTITTERLRESVVLLNRRRKVLQEINAFRKLPEPPISGIDALIVSQVALSQDVRKFIAASEDLINELAERSEKGISAYASEGPRILIAGTPSPGGNTKVHYALEASGLRVVADESCTGSRYYRDLVDETPEDLDRMIEAIADRYFLIDCSCFSPNTERMENILNLVREYAVDGVVHNVLSFCHTYNIETRAIDKGLAKVRVPSLKIVTDYSFEDLEQLKVRMESFREILQAQMAESAG
jgi:benzoyl-CoA reductase/2-hydroxyglutaryl-CoA dehydratase subunit BcrC/BadD/HgdB